MPSKRACPVPSKGTLKKVHVELFPLSICGLGETGERLVLEEELDDNTRFGDLVGRLIDKHEAVREAITDPVSHSLREQISVFINNSLVDMPQGLNMPLKDGDHIFFLMAFPGG